jgi:hypothetical protein
MMWDLLMLHLNPEEPKSDDQEHHASGPKRNADVNDLVHSADILDLGHLALISVPKWRKRAKE